MDYHGCLIIRKNPFKKSIRNNFSIKKGAYAPFLITLRPLHERGAREKKDEIWLIEAEIVVNT